ncbi:hypothetical protein N0O92_18095 [Alkalihalobacillus sp. MEB130]|uniref:hypothetical protein n=1 Tax=Alkalihalobacillus sp. MEB130 TaxID=2976704 RepID=UPI0028DDD8F4|nr:hypothetical protein [Alkalihalobacillus sp. MEB130]MDT8862126.1 hypothetical protein [Alkalihalobacillus sp. MEB130]
MMSSREARLKTIKLVKESLEELVLDNELCEVTDSKEFAEMLFNDYRKHFDSIMKMPYGATLSPEELAEGILYKHVATLSSNSVSEASVFHR